MQLPRHTHMTTFRQRTAQTTNPNAKGSVGAVKKGYEPNVSPVQSKFPGQGKPLKSDGMTMETTEDEANERRASMMEWGKARELWYKSDHWVLGAYASPGDYLKVALVSLLTAVLLYFFTGMIRGYNPNPISFGLAIAFLRGALTITTYSELRALLDPFLVILGVCTGRVTWRFGLIMFFMQVVGSAAGFGIVHGLNFGGTLIISDGAPIIFPAWVGLSGLTMTWEFLASFLCYTTILWAFGLRKVYCFMKDYAKSQAEMEVAKDGTAMQKLRIWKMRHNKMVSPGKLGASLAVAFAYGVVSFVGWSITSSAMDIFMLIWPGIYSGLFSSGYTEWWIYLVGPAIGLVGAWIFWVVMVVIIGWSYESTRKRHAAKIAKIITVTDDSGDVATYEKV